MHYADGTPASLGDLVLFHEETGDNWGAEVVGVLVSGDPASTACNGRMSTALRRQKSGLGWGHWSPISYPDFSVTIGNCLKITWTALARPWPAPQPAAVRQGDGDPGDEHHEAPPAKEAAPSAA